MTIINRSFSQVQQKDSLATRHITEVAIPGNRLPSADDLALKYLPDLSKALAQSPEIYLRQYGPTGVSSISLNGLGASQTSLEWNGVALNSSLLGQADANQFIAGGGRIQKSGGSAFSAIQAAALNLISTRPDSGITATIGQVIGSYGLASSLAGLGYNKGRLAISGQYQWNEARNDYNVQDETSANHEMRKLPNARAFRRQAELHAWHAGKLINTEAHFFTSYWGRHLAPSVQSLQSQTSESLYGRNMAFTLSEIYDRIRDSVRIQVATTRENYRYRFPAMSTPSEQFAFNRNQLSAAYFRRWINLKAGATYEMIREATPTLKSIGKKKRYIHYFTPTLLASGHSLSLGSVLFRDSVHFTPQLKLNARGVHLLVRQTFRPPTLNDLYYPVYGSLSIKPEKSTHLEIGFERLLLINDRSCFQITLNLGHYRFSNYIQWIPNNTIYQPTNLTSISNYYCNTNLVFKINISKSNILLTNGVAFTRIGNSPSYFALPEKQLIYTPIFQNFSSAEFNLDNWSISLNGKYISKRYLTTSNSNSSQDILFYFYLANARLAYQHAFRFARVSAFASFGNLFGAQYEWVQSFPMPRYEFSLGLQFETNL